MDILERMNKYLVAESETLESAAEKKVNKEGSVSFCDWDDEDEEVIATITKEPKGLNYRATTEDDAGGKTFRTVEQAINYIESKLRGVDLRIAITDSSWRR